MKALGAFFTTILASTFGLFMAAIALFSIPLNVIALMRLMGWEWWTALLAAIVIGIIPFVGQLAFLILAVLGAYFFIAAGWNWQQAVSPTVDLGQITPERFAEYKKAVLKPKLEQQCRDEGRSQYGSSGALPSFVAAYCDCYAQTVIEFIRQDELAGPGNVVDLQSRAGNAVRAKCRR